MNDEYSFTANSDEYKILMNRIDANRKKSVKPKPSVVRVYFPERNMKLAYYNDMFDLHCGDLVYVDGKLEGMQGEIIDVNYSFKIKLSDYKRVIAVIDTSVQGELYIAGSHIMAFEPDVLPYEKVSSWFKAPEENEVYAVGEDDRTFSLDDLSGMDITQIIAEKGHTYYAENRICYICVDGVSGKAIVRGGEFYDVEFTYRNGQISNLVCSCFCSYQCKHTFAVMLQLKECLESISKEYPDRYSGYFAAVSKGVFVSKILKNKANGRFTADI